jgi:class 3 adenylate cyclase
LRLSQASQAIASGELEQTIPVEPIKELGILATSFNTMTQQLKASFNELEKTNAELEQRVEERTADLRLEKERSEQLLLNILPEVIANQLKHNTKAIASAIEEVTILFADVVGFTPLSSQIPPIELVSVLNEMFSIFDHLAEKNGLEKIKTIGDAYMVVGGLPLPKANHAEAIADMALGMQAAMAEFKVPLERFNIDSQFQIRIGINTGSVVAGVIGIKKFIYDLWGDAVNIASRMESSGDPGRIQVTEATYHRIKDQYNFEKRGIISIKGKGEMTTYWLIGKK